MSRFPLGMLLLTLGLPGCTSRQVQEVGSYRIAAVDERFLIFGCQPRTEFYAVDRSAPDRQPVYLGACGSPHFVTHQMGYPSDPSCFAVAEDGSSLVFLHKPNWCGVGEAGERKPGGVYLHSERAGEQLLYAEREVGQVWSRRDIEPHAMRVLWTSNAPTRSGICPESLVIYADGRERPDADSLGAPCGVPADSTDAP